MRLFAQNNLRGLLMITRNNVMASLTYRAHFIFQTIASVFAIAVVFYLWQAVYAASGQSSLNGMSFDSTFLYMGLAAAMMVLTKTWIDWFMWEQIRFGNIIMAFFRPVDYMGSLFFQSLGIFIGNFITITIPSLVALFLLFGANIQTGWAALLFIPALFMSFVLNFCLDWLIGTTCFFTESIWGISIAKEVLTVFLSGAVIPLPFFPAPVRAVLDYLPFKSVYHTPLATLCDPTIPVEQHLLAIGVQVLWAVGLLIVCRLYFNRALRTLTVAGG